MKGVFLEPKIQIIRFEIDSVILSSNPFCLPESCNDTCSSDFTKQVDAASAPKSAEVSTSKTDDTTIVVTPEPLS